MTATCRWWLGTRLRVRLTLARVGPTVWDTQAPTSPTSRRSLPGGFAGGRPGSGRRRGADRSMETVDHGRDRDDADEFGVHLLADVCDLLIRPGPGQSPRVGRHAVDDLDGRGREIVGGSVSTVDGER